MVRQLPRGVTARTTRRPARQRGARRLSSRLDVVAPGLLVSSAHLMILALPAIRELLLVLLENRLLGRFVPLCSFIPLDDAVVNLRALLGDRLAVRRGARRACTDLVVVGTVLLATAA